jgi:hypothetical protein
VGEQGEADLGEGRPLVQVALHRDGGVLGVEGGPQRDQPGGQRPPWLQQDERLHQQPVIGQAAFPVPPAVQVGHQRAQVGRSVEGQPPDPVAVLAGEPHDVGGQGFLEAPLGLRRLAVRSWWVPVPQPGPVAGEVDRDPVATVKQFLLGGATDGAELEQVPVPDLGHRPGVPAVEQQQGPAGFQHVAQEPLVGWAETEALEAKVGHLFQHEPVLDWVVHVVDLHVGVGVQQSAGRLPAPFQVAVGVVGIVAGVADRDHEGLGQPGRAQGGGQMDRRPAGGADQGEREPAPRI